MDFLESKEPSPACGATALNVGLMVVAVQKFIIIVIQQNN